MSLMVDADVILEVIDEEWQALLEKDDRTSPAEYPDMCLISKDELACAMLAMGAAIAGLFGVQGKP